MQVLRGLTVITLEQAISAPFCTRQLADLGARVIKIERPDGGDFARGYDRRARGLSSHFVWCNRSKESLTIDLKHSQGREVLTRLLSRADIFVQNLAPGSAERLGFSYEQLCPDFPRLIVCNISGYGNGGPFGDKKAYDLLIQGESGFLSITGSGDAYAKAGNSIADISAGMYAYSNILAALLERTRTGRGKLIDVSMLEAMVEWMGYPLYYSMDGAEPPPRTGAVHATIYPYGPFITGDGGVVMFGLQNDREWACFCETVLERPDLGSDPKFLSNAQRAEERGSLDPLLELTFARFTSSEILDRLERAQIANARVNTMHDVWEHPQLVARGRWTNVQTAVGPMPALLPPGRVANDVRLDEVPILGSHTESILAEVGFDEAQITRLRQEGAI